MSICPRTSRRRGRPPARALKTRRSVAAPHVPACSKVVRKGIARVLTVISQKTRDALKEEYSGKVRLRGVALGSWHRIEGCCMG